MSNIDADLVLYLPLDEIRESVSRDVSGRGNNAIIKGNVKPIPDDVFGVCASFPGDADSFIIVPDSPNLRIAGDLTIEAWVSINDITRTWVRIVGKGFRSETNYDLSYTAPAVWSFQQSSGSQSQGCILKSVRPMEAETWYHVAAVLQAGAITLYLHDLNGKLVTPPGKGSCAGAAAAGADDLIIGYLNGGDPHKGNIAGVRVYQRALSQAEIERDIRADGMNLAAFRKSHPIDFQIHDDDQQAVLYISDDPNGQNLHLELHNTSTQVIQLTNGQGAAASETNHHFALRFRPGTLSDSAIKTLANPTERAKILKSADPWDLYFPAKPPAANEAASLYLLYKGLPNSFQPNERRALVLQGMSAAPGSGARGTQVELIPRQLTAAGGDDTPVTGSRTQYVHITNHRGRKNIPLHVGFASGNTVLNDGKSSNALRLRITNASKDGEIALIAATRFIISFDVQETGKTMEWALVTSAAAKDVNVRVGGRKIEPEKSEGIESETPHWIITFDQPPRLAAGQHMQIDLEGIVSSLPSGHANLYVRYENIPGYWDGQFVCTVEKGPIVFDRERVGIGTAEPAARLDVAGNIVAKGGLHVGGNSDPGEKNLRVDGLLLLGETTLEQEPASERKGLHIKNASLRVQEGLAVGTDANFVQWMTKKQADRRDIGSFAAQGATARNILQNIAINLKTSYDFPLDLPDETSILSLSGAFEVRFSLRVAGQATPFYQSRTPIFSVNGYVKEKVLRLSCPRELMEQDPYYQVPAFFRGVMDKEADVNAYIRTLNSSNRIEGERECRFSAFVVYAK